ncbi:MAG: hypothetical protein KDA21_00005 [Phycisphaerales bacterium]|nr:hypothetical protein [Phycisphaerales bacterium]
MYVRLHFVRIVLLIGMLHTVAAAARAVVTDIQPPIHVQASLASDVPAWDLCWSDHRERARAALASQLAASMTDPGRLYVIDLPGLDGTWQPYRGDTPRDMVGIAIPARALRDGRRTLERDLEAALLLTLETLRDLRPEARLRLGTGFSDALEAAADFTLDDASDTSSASSKKKGRKSKKKRRKGRRQQGSDDVPASAGTGWRAWSDNGQWRLETLEPPPTVLLDPPQSLRDTWSGLNEVVIQLPARQDEPFGSQHGPQTRSTLQVFPAEYSRRTDPMVGIMLSFRGTADSEAATNPRGWRRRFQTLPEQGWDTLDPWMEQLEELGFREVWFWGWSGQHPNTGGLSAEVMPWFGDDGHTDIMRASWPGFVQRWRARGFTFGYWLGGIAIPNVGTTLRPEHHYITRADFGYVADTLDDIRRHGFEAVGLDAFNWILAQRDLPEWANWKANHTGPRDRGIGLALLETLSNDRRLRGMRIVTENRAPYGPVLAAAPTLQLFSSTAAPRGVRPTVATLQPPDIEDVVNPGHEIIMMLSTDGWTRQEYDLALERITAFGYRPAIAFEVLMQAGLISNDHLD